ncbi:MAG: tRNA (adenosine(37)-N6)-dimethylallyltransferase MiaA, partial [Candidatus Hydrogenedentales bacterium]
MANAEPEVIAVVGPTGSGKSSLAVAVAERLKTEVVSADSMQFYHGMEIGTGQPTPEEQRGVPHHFIGDLDPSAAMSAGEYADAAREVIRKINALGKPAVVVGGSGLYVRALIDGLFSGPGKDSAVRERLQAEAAEVGTEALYARLKVIDPAYAAQILPGDLRRIVRALEVYELSRQPMSTLHESAASDTPLDAVQVALDWPRDALYARIEARVDTMIAAGWPDEVQRLLDAGYEPDLRRLRAIGYLELAAHLRGEASIDEAVAGIKKNTRRYAKRQLSWFRQDERIHWLPVEKPLDVDGLTNQVMSLLQLYFDLLRTIEFSCVISHAPG